MESPVVEKSVVITNPQGLHARPADLFARLAMRFDSKIEVIRDGHRDKRLEEGWDEYVEQLLPAGIAPLFFFDGEKIEQLADPTTSREILTTAINSLLGLDLIDRLSSSLRTMSKVSL